MKNNSLSAFATWKMTPTVYLIFILTLFFLPNLQAFAGTQLTANTTASTGSHTLTWSSTNTYYGTNIYENGVKIDGSTNSRYSITGKANGTYNYYVDTCYQTCTRSNTVAVTVNRGKKVIFVHTDLLGSPVAETDKNGNVQ